MLSIQNEWGSIRLIFSCMYIAGWHSLFHVVMELTDERGPKGKEIYRRAFSTSGPCASITLTCSARIKAESLLEISVEPQTVEKDYLSQRGSALQTQVQD